MVKSPSMRQPMGVSLTVPQIAECYVVDADCVRDWIKSGQLVAINVSSKVKGKLRRQPAARSK